MRILMTNWRLTWFSGSDTYLYTLAKELIKRGHEVDVYTDKVGLVARYFVDSGINIVSAIDLEENQDEPDNVSFVLKESYDVIHGHHNITVMKIDQKLPSVPKIFVCHGVLPDIEKPPEGVYIEKFVSVSEETRDMLEKDFKKDAVSIIRNFVDLDRFKKKRVAGSGRGKLKILIISNYYFNEWDAKEVWEAAKELNAEINVLGGNGIMAWDIEPYIQKADIVIGLGRGILEAMACERPVIVGDYNGYEGLLTKDNYKEIRKCNFSGRSFKKEYGVKELVRDIETAKKIGLAKLGKQNRKLVEKYHNVKEAANKFEEIYEGVQ